MHQVLTDLWQTRTDSPFPGLTTHAFLWTGRNALFYSDRDATPTSKPSRNSAASPTSTCRTATRPGPMLARIADRFDSSSARSRRRVARDRPARPCRRSAGQPPCRRQRCRSHPDARTLTGQHLLPGRRRRGQLPVHRRHTVSRRIRGMVGRLHPRHQRRRCAGIEPATAAHARPPTW